MGRAQLAAGLAAAVVFGTLTAAPAALACDPTHDPGQHCRPKPLHLGGITGAKAFLDLERSEFDRYVFVHEGSFVEDTADDGLDAHLWVSYSVYRDGTTGPRVEERLATASGLGTKSYLTWAKGDIEGILFRVCNGPGDTVCGMWS